MIDWLAMAGAAVFFFILSRAAAVQRSAIDLVTDHLGFGQQRWTGAVRLRLWLLMEYGH
jgi:hypothetical protein